MNEKPDINQLTKDLAMTEIDRVDDNNVEFFTVYRVQAYALLHIALWLETIAGELEQVSSSLMERNDPGDRTTPLA